MGGILCCNLSSTEKEIDYGDYIFNHERLLKIIVSNVLIDHVNIDDFIYLRVCIHGNVKYHTCKVHLKRGNSIYVSFITPLEDYSEIKYIKKL